MTKSSRRSLFYALVALFLIVGTGVVLYAQGWRLDITTGQASKIGAIYVRSSPENAGISLDGKPIENTSGFLAPGTLISDLFPKTYALTLTAPGYDAWHESVTVAPSLVVPLKYAVLVPQDATPAASGSISAFLVRNDTITLQNSNDDLTIDGEPIGNGKIISATSDQESLIFQETDGSYRFFDAKSGRVTSLPPLLSETGIAPDDVTNLAFDPSDADVILITAQQSLWLDEAGYVTQIEKTPKTATISSSVAISGSWIAWTQLDKASDTSALVLYDRNAQSLEESSTTMPGATGQLTWINGSLLGIMQSDGSLYLYDTNSGTLRKLADDGKDFAASDDGTMIAALEHASVEIFSPNDPSVYYRFNLPDIADARQLIWYRDDNHLFVVYPDHISFLDLADTSLDNFTTVAEGTSPQYDASENSLYLISPTGTLERFDFS